MKYGYLPPAKKNPNQVHHNRDASWLIGAIHKFMTKRPQSVCAQLEELNAKRNTYYCDAHKESYQIVEQGYNNTAQD